VSAALSEYEYEPVPGLPERLPAGETLLWQGAPCWRALALRAFMIRELAAYFAILTAWRVWILVSDHEPLHAAAGSLLMLVGGGAAAIGMLALLAWYVERTTLYSITSARVVMRFGIALPMTVNIPFRIVASVAMHAGADGNGDIALALGSSDRIAYLSMWPHVRRWRFARPEPMLRAVPEAGRVGQLLASALAGIAAPAESSGAMAAALPPTGPSGLAAARG
jgi:hypothetical protein